MLMLNIASAEKLFKRRRKKKKKEKEKKRKKKEREKKKVGKSGLNPAHLHGSPATALHYGATNEIRRNLPLYHSSFSLTDALAYSTAS